MVSKAALALSHVFVPVVGRGQTYSSECVPHLLGSSSGAAVASVDGFAAISVPAERGYADFRRGGRAGRGRVAAAKSAALAPGGCPKIRCVARDKRAINDG